MRVRPRKEAREMQQRFPSLDEVVTGLAELRPLGAVANRVLQLTEGDRFSAHELALVISSDQALTAKMLRLSNSAYYGFPRRITTVRDAVVLLGFRAVRSSVLATCLVDALPGTNTLDYKDFWHFSLTVGTTAEILSRVEGAHQDEAFTAGVLHNIGRLSLDQFVPHGFAAAVSLARERGIRLTDAQQEVLGYTDAEVGGALALHWSFPPELADAVRNHALDPDVLPEPKSLTAQVVRARLFARSYGLPDGIERDEPFGQPAEWSVPPLSVALTRGGGIDGLLERVEAFMDSAVLV
jgi:HD-like signal output (HDOD) protein